MRFFVGVGQIAGRLLEAVKSFGRRQKGKRDDGRIARLHLHFGDVHGFSVNTGRGSRLKSAQNQPAILRQALAEMRGPLQTAGAGKAAPTPGIQAAVEVYAGRDDHGRRAEILAMRGADAGYPAAFHQYFSAFALQ